MLAVIATRATWHPDHPVRRPALATVIKSGASYRID